MDATSTFPAFASFESFTTPENLKEDINIEDDESQEHLEQRLDCEKGPKLDFMNDEDTWASDFQSFEQSKASTIIDDTADFQGFETNTTNFIPSHSNNGDFQGFETNQTLTKNGISDGTADLQGFETNTTTDISNSSQFQKSKDVIQNCFETFGDSNSTCAFKCLEKSFKESTVYTIIKDQVLDPVKAKKTLTNKLKLDQIESLLDLDKAKEDWIVNVTKAEIGIFRNNFDFHTTSSKNQVVKKSNLASPKITTHNQIRRFSNEKKLEKEVALDYNGTSQKVLELEEEMKKSFIELSSKSVEDLRNIVKELEIEAKIYSELLLSELDYRDNLVRQQEIKNNFISKHVAVERKISEIRKKKRNYSFFKYPDDGSSKFLEWTIPYFCQEEGPKPTELALMTDILTAIEKDDPETPKLISEYVFKLGNSFDLDTVIQIRTKDGVKRIGNSTYTAR